MRDKSGDGEGDSIGPWTVVKKPRRVRKQKQDLRNNQKKKRSVDKMKMIMGESIRKGTSFLILSEDLNVDMEEEEPVRNTNIKPTTSTCTEEVFKEAESRLRGQNQEVSSNTRRIKTDV